MPFQPGNKLGGGARTYELERAQLEKMRSILDKDLKIIERLQDAEVINPVDEKKLQISQARVSKYLDKLHATRETREHSGEINLPRPIVDIKNLKDGFLHNNGNKEVSESGE